MPDGANSYGQLGLGYKCEQKLKPEEISIPCELQNNISSINGGAGHTIILDNNGHLYSCGWNTKGQLGFELEILKFTKIEALNMYKIVQVSCGWDFNAALTENGQVFVWGSNALRQLGLPKSVKYTSSPTLLEINNIKYVNCGVRHMALITKEGKIIVSGNGNKGQLGLIGSKNEILRECTLQVIPDLENMVSVSCGQNHTLAFKSDGTIYVWGHNKHGQLGIHPDIQDIVPTPVKLNTSVIPKDIYSGWTHSAILTQEGEIYSFGRNSYSQLGAERECSWIPTRMEIDTITKLCLGSEHNLAINTDKELLCWGWNEHGNCGTGDVDVKVPTKILRKVINIGTGTGQSFAVIED